MNQEQFKIWEKQKWREYEVELKKLQEDFADRGLAFSGIRNKEEKELKVKYENQIEIARLNIKEHEGDFYIKILEWANNRPKFKEQELYAKFPKLNDQDFKAWFLNLFRGANNNDDCLIGVYDDRQGSFYYSLTAKGKSTYLNLKQNQFINIERMETTYGDKINGDKIEQHGNNHKAAIKKKSLSSFIGEGFVSKFFWQIIGLLFALIAAYIIYKIGWN